MLEREETRQLTAAVDKFIEAVVEDALRKTIAAVEQIVRSALPDEMIRAATSRLLNLEQAGAYLGRSPEAMRHLMRRREIPAVRDGYVIRFDRAELDKWIERKTV